jgi:hypothetical protein
MCWHDDSEQYGVTVAFDAGILLGLFDTEDGGGMSHRTVIFVTTAVRLDHSEGTSVR